MESPYESLAAMRTPSKGVPSLPAAGFPAFDAFQWEALERELEKAFPSSMPPLKWTEAEWRKAAAQREVVDWILQHRPKAPR